MGEIGKEEKNLVFKNILFNSKYHFRCFCNNLHLGSLKVKLSEYLSELKKNPLHLCTYNTHTYTPFYYGGRFHFRLIWGRKFFFEENLLLSLANISTENIQKTFSQLLFELKIWSWVSVLEILGRRLRQRTRPKRCIRHNWLLQLY